MNAYAPAIAEIPFFFMVMTFDGYIWPQGHVCDEQL